MAHDAGATLLSGPLRYIALGVAAITLVLFFIAAGFPYEPLSDFISSEVRRSSGSNVAIRDLGPSLQVKGPALRAAGLRIDSEAGDTLEFEAATLRLAWSLSWLRGQPAFYITLEGPQSAVEGSFTLGSELGFAGSFSAADIEELPLEAALPDLHLEGSAEFEMDVRRGLSGPEGWIRFELSNGSIAFGDFPLAIPYERIHGKVDLGDDAFLQIEALKLDGPMMNAEITGTVESAPAFEIAPLKIQIQIRAEPAIQNALASAGVRFAGDGTARIRLSGTPREPLIQ